MDETKIKEISLKYIEAYFNENTLVDHQLDSCNYFYDVNIREIFDDLNPIEYIYKDSKDNDMYKVLLYIGGRDLDKIKFNSPMIIEDDHKRALYPNEARLKNITYATTIYYKVDVDFVFTTKKKTVKKTYPEVDDYELGSFPIMIKSKQCILNKLSKEVCYQLGECRHDYGGYFIIDGKEKVIIPQEKFGDNLIYIRTLKDNKHDYSIEIRSVSEDHSKPKRTMAIRRDIKRGHFLVDIPNVRLPIPLFIVFRALGIISDKDICKCILSDLEDNDKYLELLRPSINDAGTFYTQLACLNYISVFLKHTTINETHNILTNYLFPHMGEMNYTSKALFLGYMTYEVLKVIHGDRTLTDRDNYKFKRVETTGGLMKDLFTEYSKIMKQEIHTIIEKEMYYNNSIYIDENLKESDFNPEKSNILSLIKDHIFSEKYIENGFKKAFKGDWGAYGHTKRLGVIQDLNRLSYNSFLTHLRKINLEVDSSSKLMDPHFLHGSQYGYLDPVDTPDGANVGLHKHMAIMCKITRSVKNQEVYDFIENNFNILSLEISSYEQIHNHFRLFINGIWVGIINEDPIEFKNKFIDYRRRGIIPYSISISIQINDKYVFIYSDEGRLIRPLMYYENEELIINQNDKLKWSRLVKTKSESFVLNEKKDKVYLEYIDSSEVDMCFIGIQHKNKGYTHLEIHPSLMFGIMGNQTIFPENNQLPRNLFSCGQAKQAVSLYHSNFINRIDKMGIILNYGQKPIVRTRYFNYIHEEQHPYGENVIVAIMCHTSYNVEDAILINESSVKRGLFKTTYFNMYETMDEITIAGKNEKRIGRVSGYELARDTKPGYNYNKLDKDGLVFENTLMDDKTVVIGRLNIINNEVFDSSIVPKKGQLGYVDKTFIYDKDGRKLAKVRIREDRSPAIGDKFCSRCGQKGTIGNLIPEENMPFTKSGLKPDIIVNPHALPSRMTIGQLIETILSKLCCANGMSADSTAFINKGPKHEIIGKHLNQLGYQSEGNEILYNGLTGEQITSEIFMGPTYYMRLKHMVKDKINYRATGQRDLLTRQTNHGRANDGGLRIGEMERDGVISHGMTGFLKDSMMKRGDEYKMAVCNQTGSIALYHKEKQYFYSLLSDGPIEYDMTDQSSKPYLITKYGKEFSVVNIPYSFKLLIQELTTINVHMRLITSENISKLIHTSNVYLKDKLAGEDFTDSESITDTTNDSSELEDISSTFNNDLSVLNNSNQTRSKQTPSNQTRSNQNISNQSVSNQDLLNTSVSNQNISNQSVSNEFTPSNQSILNQPPSNEFTPSNQTSNQFTPSNQTSNQFTPSNQTSNQFTPSNQTSNQTPSNQTSNQFTPSNQTSNQFTSNQFTTSNETPSNETLSNQTSNQFTTSNETPSNQTSNQTPNQFTSNQFTTSNETLSNQNSNQFTPSNQTPNQFTPSNQTSNQTPNQFTSNQFTTSNETPSNETLSNQTSNQFTTSNQTPSENADKIYVNKLN